jgi:hypothetical protein
VQAAAGVLGQPDRYDRGNRVAAISVGTAFQASQTRLKTHGSFLSRRKPAKRAGVVRVVRFCAVTKTLRVPLAARPPTQTSLKSNHAPLQIAYAIADWASRQSPSDVASGEPTSHFGGRWQHTREKPTTDTNRRRGEHNAVANPQRVSPPRAARTSGTPCVGAICNRIEQGTSANLQRSVNWSSGANNANQWYTA